MKNILSGAEKNLIRKLHESEYFIEQIVNCTPDIIYVLDLEKNKFTFISKRAEEVMGAENILLDKIHPFDQASRQQHIAGCRNLHKNEIKDIDIRMRVRSGQWSWFNIRDIAFTLDDHGNTTHIMGVMRDIQEEKMREQSLVYDQQLLRGLCNSLNLGIAIYKAVRNPNGDIIDFEFVLATRAFEEFHGRSNLVGKWLFEEFPGIKESMYDLFRRIMETGNPFRDVASYPNPVTKKMHLFMLKYERFGDGFMISWEDITHESNPALSLANRSADSANSESQPRPGS